MSGKMRYGLFSFLTVLLLSTAFGCGAPNEQTQSPDKGASENRFDEEEVSVEPEEVVVPSPAPNVGEVKSENKPKSNSGAKLNSHTSRPGKVKPGNPGKSIVDIVKNFPPLVKIPDSVAVENAVELMEGQISYYIPDSIEVGEFFVVSVMISDTGRLPKKMILETAKLSAVADRKVAPEDVRFEEIKIAEIVRAELSEPQTDEKHFTIDPEGIVEQRLSKKENFSTLWQWTVVANEPGDHPLVLKLEAVFYDEKDEEIVEKIPVFAEKVFVASVSNNSWMPYVLGGAFAALFTALFMWFRSRKSASDKDDSGNINFIVEKIAAGETAESIKLLRAKTLSQTNENLLVNHLAEFNDIRRQFNGGMIERSEMQTVVNRIHNSLLEICDEIKG